MVSLKVLKKSNLYSTVYDKNAQHFLKCVLLLKNKEVKIAGNPRSGK